MKASEFRKLIREEVRKVITEDEFLRTSDTAPSFEEPIIKVGDYVKWDVIVRGGMGRYVDGWRIGQVKKIFGSANIEVEVVLPVKSKSGAPAAGKVWKVSKKEADRIPVEGETFRAKVSGSSSGAGSGSGTGAYNIQATVIKVDIANNKLKGLTPAGKKIDLQISSLSNIKISTNE